MKLPKYAIKNQQFVFILVILLLFLGVRSFTSMPKSEDPALNLPYYTIIAVYPGTSPTDMEELIVDPIENVIDELDDIIEIRTEITNGLTIIQVKADFGIDYDDKYDEILSEVNAIKPELPSGLYALEINQYKPEDRNVIQQIALNSSNANYLELIDQAEALQDKIELIDAVKKVEIEAAPKEEIQVLLDLNKMTELRVPLKQVIQILQQNNQNIPGGDIEGRKLAFNIQTSGSYKTISKLLETTIRSNNVTILKLSHFASVHKTHEEPKWYARFNQTKTIFLTVYQKTGTNILRLEKQLRRTREKFTNQLPSSIALDIAFDQAPAVQDRLHDFLSNLLQGILLVGVIIWLFLGWRPSIVVMTVIPLSIVIAITALDFTGYAMQQISIAALVIALGLLVDNAIVVIENIVNFKRDGYSLLEAAAKGTSEVSYAIISSTITTVLAFAPLALLQSGPGEYLRSLPLTVIYTLIGSLILALVLTPIISSKVLPKKSINNQTFLSGLIEKVISKIYRPTLKLALKKGAFFVLGGLALLGFSISLFPSIGVSFFPTADKSLLLISVDLPYSASLSRTDDAVSYVESILDTTEYVDNYSVNIGHGNPQVYYNRVPEEYKKYHGEVLVNFKEWDQEKFYFTLDYFKETFSNYSDARISFRELKNGSPFEAPVEFIIEGEQLTELKNLAAKVEEIVRNTEGTRDVENPFARSKTDLSVNIDRDKAALYNVSLLDIDLAVRAATDGIKVDEITLENDNETYPIVLKNQTTIPTQFEALHNTSIVSNSGEKVPLNQLASIEMKPEYAKLSHFNTVRSIGVTSNVTNPDQTKEITENIIAQLEKFEWPAGYSYRVGGEYEAQQQSFGDLGTLLLLALIGIFAVLVLQFRSIIQPLIIFSAIPLAVTGSFVALYLTGWSFSFFAFVGFISLVGIVVNNSIILVDYTNQLINEGADKKEAIQRAAERRFQPIILTTLTTILGLIPLTFTGTSLWSPLGWTLIGGLLSSMLLTLVIVPILYNWFTRSNKIKQLQES